MTKLVTSTFVLSGCFKGVGDLWQLGQFIPSTIFI